MRFLSRRERFNPSDVAMLVTVILAWNLSLTLSLDKERGFRSDKGSTLFQKLISKNR